MVIDVKDINEFVVYKIVLLCDPAAKPIIMRNKTAKNYDMNWVKSI